MKKKVKDKQIKNWFEPELKSKHIIMDVSVVYKGKHDILLKGLTKKKLIEIFKILAQDF